MRKANKTSFKPGHGGGRPKGVINKRTLRVQKSAALVIEKILKQPGSSLSDMAQMDPSMFYNFASRLIDAEMRNE